MKWYSTIFKKNRQSIPLTGSKRVPKNIYGTTNKKKLLQQFHVVHFFFKYKFLVPLVFLGKKILKKHLVTKVPRGNHNRNLKLFDQSFEEAIKKWCLYYIRNTGEESKRPGKKVLLKRAKNSHLLRTMKEFVNTLYIHDTAYREFVNILLHEITIHMTKYYAQHPDKETGHLFFTTDIYEVNYYVLEKYVEYKVSLGATNAEELLANRMKEAKR